MLIIRHIENAIILVEMFSILSHAYSSLQEYDEVISSNWCTLNTFESASQICPVSITSQMLPPNVYYATLNLLSDRS